MLVMLCDTMPCYAMPRPPTFCHSADSLFCRSPSLVELTISSSYDFFPFSSFGLGCSSLPPSFLSLNIGGVRSCALGYSTDLISMRLKPPRISLNLAFAFCVLTIPFPISPFRD